MNGSTEANPVIRLCKPIAQSVQPSCQIAPFSFQLAWSYKPPGYKVNIWCIC